MKIYWNATAEYRPVSQIPCEPILCRVIGESVIRPGRILIDCGSTGCAAPNDRDMRIVHRGQLTVIG